VVSLNGVVGIVSSLVASVMKPIRRRYRTMLAIFLVSDLAMFGFAFGHNVPTIVLTSVATTPLFVLGGVLWESLMQTEVPSELMGRASAVDWFFSLALSPIGLAISGPLMDRYGVHAYYAYATAIAAIPGLCALLSRRGAAIDAGR
jgi:predicted MFS family arabinose efflux permease